MAEFAPHFLVNLTKLDIFKELTKPPTGHVHLTEVFHGPIAGGAKLCPGRPSCPKINSGPKEHDGERWGIDEPAGFIFDNLPHPMNKKKANNHVGIVGPAAKRILRPHMLAGPGHGSWEPPREHTITDNLDHRTEKLHRAKNPDHLHSGPVVDSDATAKPGFAPASVGRNMPNPKHADPNVGAGSPPQQEPPTKYTHLTPPLVALSPRTSLGRAEDLDTDMCP